MESEGTVRVSCMQHDCCDAWTRDAAQEALRCVAYLSNDCLAECQGTVMVSCTRFLCLDALNPHWIIVMSPCLSWRCGFDQSRGFGGAHAYVCVRARCLYVCLMTHMYVEGCFLAWMNRVCAVRCC